MRKFLLTMMLVPLMSLANTEVVDGVEWTYTVVDGKAEVGAYYYSYGYVSAISPATTGAITVPSTLGGFPVERIGVCAFLNCNRLTSVTIPDGVTDICSQAFGGCVGLKSVTMPAGVASIGTFAFDGCAGLRSVAMPASITHIGDFAFEGCTGLKSVTIPACVENLSETFPSAYASIAKADILDGVTSIGDRAFADCSCLQAVTIPPSVTSIGVDAFDDCDSLQVVFVTDVPQDCVKQCFGEGMWYQKAGMRIDYDWEYSYEDGTVVIAGVRPAYGDLVIPSDLDGCPVTSIADSAFCSCDVLTSVVIPEGVTSIGRYAFCDCSGLASVTIPSSVTNIGDYAFYNCSNLSSLTLHAGVKSIGADAFKGCNGLTLTFEGRCPENYMESGILDVKKVNFPSNYIWSYPTIDDAVNELGYWIGMYGRQLDIYDEFHDKYFQQISGGVYIEGRGGDGVSWVSWPSWLKLGVDGVPFNADSVTFGYENSEFTAIADYGACFCICSDVLVSSLTMYSGGVSSELAVLRAKDEGGPYKMGECVALHRNNDYGAYCQVSVGSDGFSYSGDYGIFHKGVYYYKIPSADNTDAWYWYHGQDDLYKFKTWFLYVDCGTGGTAYTLEVEPTCKSYCIEFDVSSHAPYGAAFRQFTVETVSDPYTDDWYSINLDMSDCTELPYEIVDYEWWVLESNDWGDIYETCETVPTRHYEAGFAVDPGWCFIGWKLENGSVRDAEGNLLRTGGVVESVQDMVAESSAKFVAVYEPITYCIAFEDIKGCENANTNAYTVEDEVIFLPLADLPDWHFDGWSPASIPVGSTGDVTVVAQWRPIETAEIVGAWSEPQTFEYDGKVHGVDYSARLDVMEWPLNVVTQGTIRAVNVGEYAATARAETVGVPETDSVYYRCAAVTNECNWTITTKPVTKLQIDYVSTAMIANGQQQKPQIVVRDVERGVVLTSADYALVYENNVEPGMGVARITGRGNYGGETTIEFPIVAGVSPAEGLNMDGGTFEIVGETDWVADNVVTHDRYASMRSGAIGDNEESALTAVVHGAGTVSFWWKVSSQHFDSVLELDRLEFYVDGVRQKWVNGDVDWTKLSFKVNGAGPHELKWVYAKDGSVSERQDCGWVDEVSWEKEWLIGDWLNDVDREFATSDVKWSPDASVNSDGVGSMRNGVCQQGQRSVLSTVVENVGTLTFKWKCSCVAYGEYVTDKLALLVDGVPAKDAVGKDIFINGETGWCDVSYRITGAGRHEVQWVFEKVSDASMGQNCGWVDAVRWNNEPGTLTDEDLVVEAFDGVYDGQGHGAAVAVKGVQDASVKYGVSRETIGDTESPTFANCGEHEVWFAVNVPDFNEYVGKTIVRIRPRSIETGEVTLGESLVYTGLVLTQTVSSVVVDGLAATFDVSDNTACAAGAYQLSVAGTGNFCGELSVSFAIAKAQAPLGDVTVEGYSAEAGAVEFTYDGEAHQPTVAVGYDGAAVVRFALTEDGPYGDVLDVSNAVERLDVWYEILSANFERLVGQTQMTIRPKSIEGGAVVLGPQISDVDGRVVQTVASVTADGLDATFEVEDNAVDEVGDYELTVRGTGNFTGSIVVSYSVAGIVLPPVLTPGDGTVFTDLVTIVFSNQTEGAKHYFTTNGVNPDTSSLTVKRIRLNRKTTIKAFSVLEGSLRSAMVEATYAFGYCQTPVVRLQDCESDVFNFQNQMVVVDWNEADGVLRYTVDGSDPTTESAVYEGPFAISASTTVKAKVFSDRFFDSEVVTGDFRYERLTVAAPVVTAADEFTGTSTKVGMSCATEGAVIRYTLDGSEPTGDSVAYLEPFDVPCELGKSVEIKVRAFCDGYDSSEIVTTEVRRIWGYGDAIGVPDWQFASDEGSAAWFAVTNVTGEGEIALRSGVAQDGGKSSLKTRVSTAGTLTFNWMADTEESLGLYDWDHAEFRVDGVPVAWIDGQWTGWITVKCELIQSDCGHELEWVYTKDEMDSEWGDTVYLSDVRMSNDDISPNLPSVVGDERATVTGDAETGFVVKPSEGKTAVEVTIPPGVDAAKVTVEVSTKVASVKPNGARVKIVSGGADITEFLNMPAADGNGIVDLTKAMVKEEIVKETMDPAKGAEIKLDAANPTLITPNTRKGLFYQLREGETLDGMKAGDSKVGDGEPWTPNITVKGGNSAFYSIGVGKGE